MIELSYIFIVGYDRVFGIVFFVKFFLFWPSGLGLQRGGRLAVLPRQLRRWDKQTDENLVIFLPKG